MLNITTAVKQSKKENGEEYIIVNGIEDQECHYYQSGGFKREKEPFEYVEVQNHVSLTKEEIVKILQSHTFNEVQKFLNDFSYWLDLDWCEHWLEVKVVCGYLFRVDGKQSPVIRINFSINKDLWAKPWNLIEFCDQFTSQVEALDNPQVILYCENADFPADEFGIDYLVQDRAVTIMEEVEKALSIIRTLNDKAEKCLISAIDTEALVTYFTFEENTGTICKQYLIYFAQFLMDLGIEADTEIKSQATSTLLKVIPKHKNESLERIKAALEIYLNAPAQKDFDILTSTFNDLSVKQWEANILHLKSQLILANALIQTKEAQIEALQLSNYQYRQLVFNDSNKAPDSGEDLVKDLVTVKKFEGSGYSINLPEILRRLKRRFKL